MPETNSEGAPGAARRLWDALYDYGYETLRVGAHLTVRVPFRVHYVHGVPDIPSGPLIVCANHASYFDPAFVQLPIRRRIVFMMTNTFYRSPWGRWFFRSMRTIPVGSGRLAKIGLERAVGELRKGRIVGIFPEGRLTTDGRLGKPQRGVSILARMGRAPVLPIGISGNFRAWSAYDTFGHKANVRMSFGELIPPPPAHPPMGREDERAYAARVMEAIAIERSRARKA